MKIKTDQLIRGRDGQPFFDIVKGEQVDIELGKHIISLLDGIAVGSVGDYRKVGSLGDRFAVSNGEIDLCVDEVKILQDVIKAAKVLRTDLRRSLDYLLWKEDLPAAEQKSIAEWYGETLHAPKIEN